MLKHKARGAVLWSAGDLFVRQGLSFAITVVLARLLTPEQFGTVALLSLFTGVAAAFVDAGFSSALVQRQDITHVDESTVFWFNLVIGLVVALALAGLSPLIAAVFQLPVLIPLTCALAGNVFITAAGSVHSTLFTKRLDFRTQAKIGGIAAVVSGAVGIGLAWWGFGVWALVGQTISASVATTALLWVLSPWRPAFVFSRASASRLFRFGGYLMASALFDVVYNRLYTLLIGKFYGVRELGFFNRADGLQRLPVDILTRILARVSFPLFSAANADADRMRRMVQMATRSIMLVTLPAMLGLAAIAHPFTVALFGSQWAPAAPILEVLCFAGVLWPLHGINLNVLKAQGHSDLFFRLEVIKKTIGTALLLAGSAFGVMGIAYSRIIAGVFSFAVNSHYTGKHLGYGGMAQLRDVLPIAAPALIMASVVKYASTAIVLPPALEVLALIPLGLAVYGSLVFAFRLTALHEVLDFLHPALRARFTRAAPR